MNDPDACVICGGKKTGDASWRTYCELCATQTWGPGVVAGFIQQYVDCTERLKEAEAKLRMRDQHGM